MLLINKGMINSDTNLNIPILLVMQKRRFQLRAVSIPYPLCAYNRIYRKYTNKITSKSGHRDVDWCDEWCKYNNTSKKGLPTLQWDTEKNNGDQITYLYDM